MITQSHQPAAHEGPTWENCAQMAMSAMRLSGIWPADAEAPMLVVAKAPHTLAQKALAHPLALPWIQTGARMARRFFPSARASAPLLSAAHGQSGSALAIAEPGSLAMIIPQSWASGCHIEMRDAMGLREDHFRFVICAHELGHLALAARKNPSQGMAEALVGAAGLPAPEQEAILKAIGPRHPDDGWAMIQSQWRSMLFEGLADSCAASAAAAAGLGPAKAFANAIATARKAEMAAANENLECFSEEGGRDHDTRSAMARVAAREPGLQGASGDLFADSARMACLGLLDEMRACLANAPDSAGALLLVRQGAFPKPRENQPPLIDFSKRHRPAHAAAQPRGPQP